MLTADDYSCRHCGITMRDKLDREPPCSRPAGHYFDWTPSFPADAPPDLAAQLLALVSTSTPATSDTGVRVSHTP